MSTSVEPVMSGESLLDQITRAQRAIVRDRRVHLVLQIVSAVLASVLLWRALLVMWPLGRAASMAVLAGVIAVAVLAVWYARGRAAWSPVPLPRVALWIEEQVAGAPTHALVTWVELKLQPSGRPEASPPDSLQQAAARAFAQVPLASVLTARRWTLWRGPLLFVVGAVLLLAIPVAAPSDKAGSADRADATQDTRVSDAGTVTPLGSWRVIVEPPRYARRPSVSYEDATSIQALSGSRVVVQGSGVNPEAALVPVGNADSVRTTGRERLVPVTRTQDSWRVQLAADDAVQALRVSRGESSRLLIIEGIRDSIPRVTLEQPVRDSVFRTASGTLPLLARAHDDLGVARANFELIVSSGEGERYTVRTVTVAAQEFAPGSRDVTWRGVFDLSAYDLQPGDVVHLRAVARDAHPAAAREFGTSETRAFRIARRDEYDSVAVEPAPPPAVDSSLLSQRMLLMLTQKLDARKQKLSRAELLRESIRLARDQARLRLAVGDVVFQRLSGESSAEHAHYAGDGHDHGVDQQGGKLAMGTSNAGMLEEGNDSPIVAINKPLLEAYNAMWDAGRALEQGETHVAIPAMERALEAIERSRAASRLYLRGRPPQVIVDIGKVRLTGKDTGQTLPRSARERVPQRDAERDARLVRAVRLAADDPQAASAMRDSLALLRAESLTEAPAFAAALARVLDDLAQGRDITTSVVEARRVLGNVRRSSRGDQAPWSSGGTP